MIKQMNKSTGMNKRRYKYTKELEEENKCFDQEES